MFTTAPLTAGEITAGTVHKIASVPQEGILGRHTMRIIALTGCLLMLSSGAFGYTHWNNVRHSALLPNGEIAVRVENVQGTGVENYILYAGAGIMEEAMVPLLDGPSTLSAEVPGALMGTRYYGFRLRQGESLDLMPVRLADGADPVPQDLTRLAEDPAGDHLFGYINLDLVDCHVSFSGDRLYAALKNAGGGFPVISGLTFFGYLLAIADPAQSDPDTVFGLMQTYNQPGIISPGLYKITGTGMSDLIKIGDVAVEEFPGMNTLMISCDLDDLMADPYFLSWYDLSDPAIGVAAFTQRITLLGGAQESDRSPGGQCYLREFAVAPVTNHVPELYNFNLQGTGSEAFAEITYWDADGNCPVVAEIVFDDTLAFPMYPLALDYGSPVVYRTNAGLGPMADDSWTRAVLRFSDDSTNVTEYTPPTNAVPSNDGNEMGGTLTVEISPNPSSSAATIQLALPESGHLSVSIYGTNGRMVRGLADHTVSAGPNGIVWDCRDDFGAPVPPGIYFLRVSALGQEQVRKLVRVR